MAAAILAITSSSFVQAQDANKNKILVMIDPARGGADRGVALSKNYFEKDVVLAIAQAVQKEFAASDKFQVRLTRSSDQLISIADRIKMVQSANPDIFISLHVNAGFGPEASGFEMYFPGFKASSGKKSDSSDILKDMTKNKYLNDSVKLSQLIDRNMQSVFPRKSRGLREADVLILQGVTVPAVDLEIAFATNREDREKLMDDKSREEIAKAIASSVKEFFQGQVN